MTRGRPREFAGPYQQQFEDGVQRELDRRAEAASIEGHRESRSGLVRLIVSGLTSPVRTRPATDAQREALAKRDREAAALAGIRRRAKRASSPRS